MKLKNILFPALLALGLIACNEKTTHYEGEYHNIEKPQNDKNYSLIFEKIDNSADEYKITSFLLGKPIIESGKIKNEKYLYSPKGTLMGEFEGNNFKSSNGIIFSKIK
ncbi:hypothetical protein [Gilliamella sp. BG6]|uniref:hypothetical protein n=1 Tax=unclassified Gilliamella TaxID=2685620 RepID=UPI003986089A